ncbi:GAF domain-containing sensor histidine kinase [Bacillus sp. CHD6a]|uniref:GAF domain-containing sensor histidine kinase n=1 Tax=Bacillus sp. CHD6a TaxID=1643452 RepID=UPI000A5B3A7D|nr:GAF domain-containing sensor histidine kinase [Bacillus sp. CHD6a]
MQMHWKGYHVSQLYMGLISLIGLLLFGYHLVVHQSVTISLTLVLLVVFLFICEYYPMPMPRGQSTLTFPIIYMMYVVFGIDLVILIYALTVLVINFIHRRPLRILFFNPAQLIISFYLAHIIHRFILEKIVVSQYSSLTIEIVGFFLIISFFYLINNFIVDIVLWLRPEKYPLRFWIGKNQGEIISYAIAFVYGCLIHYLGSQNRGEVDSFSFFFFFSPLVGLSLLSSIIARLKVEKNRIKALFDFSSELNKSLTSQSWEGLIKKLIGDIMIHEDCVLFLRTQEGKWELTTLNGRLMSPLIEKEVFFQMESLESLMVFDRKDSDMGPLSPYIRTQSRSVLYAPLLVENEVIGCFVVTKTRTKSFTIEDTRAVATIANQLASFFKTKQLLKEQEQRVILEERNRIAHDIHDGIAQSLAGAVMKLDTSIRKLDTDPHSAKQLISDSNKQLRDSLKDVRDSIYALKPYPTEKLGFHTAIERKIKELKKDQTLTLNIELEIRGERGPISPMTEKVMFDVFQESVQNCIKHAKATKLHILVSYKRDHILLKMTDNGIGFSLYHAMIKAMNQPHYGILQMNESAEKIGAALQIESKTNEGTEIILTVPKLGLEGTTQND